MSLQLGKKYLIFDFGASNGRAIVANYDGERATMEVVHRFEHGPVYLTGTLYWDILHLFSQLLVGLQASCRKYPTIRSMAIDTWGCDFGFIDQQGKLVANPVTYRDPNRHHRSHLLYRLLPRRELFELSAGSTTEIMGIFQLFSFKHENSLEIRSGHKLLMVPDLLNYFLTGRVGVEYTNATMTLLCDQYHQTWEKKILDRLGITFSILPELIMPGDIVETIQPEVSDLIGVEPIVVVAPATHDTASAVAGIPVIAEEKPWVFISLGTWAIVGIETPKPILSETVFKSNYGNNAIPEGKNMLVKYIPALWIIQQCRNRWIIDSGENLNWDDIVQAAVTAGRAKAYIDVDNPLFEQPQADMPGTIQTDCRRTNQAVPETMGEVARSFYESLVLKFRYNLELLERIGGRKFEILHIVGGGSQNKTLCQWIADASGILVIAGPAETTSMGNLIMQLKAEGEIENLREGREISLRSSAVSYHEPGDRKYWDEAYEKYLQLFSSE
ncbi:MAG: rhamnulokinase [Candidatus Atribacteria bacterium]|nr:rhamnulokinase [Candidatus Atribacteria bacterium]